MSVRPAPKPTGPAVLLAKKRTVHAVVDRTYALMGCRIAVVVVVVVAVVMLFAAVFVVGVLSVDSTGRFDPL